MRKSEEQGSLSLGPSQWAPTSEHVIPGLLGLEMLQPIQVLLAVVEVVLEGAVTVVAEVTLPHGHLCQVLSLHGKPQSTQSECGGNATPKPMAHHPDWALPEGKAMLREEDVLYRHHLTQNSQQPMRSYTGLISEGSFNNLMPSLHPRPVKAEPEWVRRRHQHFFFLILT